MASKDEEVNENDNSSSEDEFYDTLSDISKEAEKAKEDIPTITSLQTASEEAEDSNEAGNHSNSENVEETIIKTEHVEETIIKTSENRVTEDDTEQLGQPNEANESTFNSDLVNDQESIDGIKESKNEDSCSSCSEEEEEKGFMERNKEQLNEGLAAEGAECEEEGDQEVDGSPEDDDPDGEVMLRELEDSLSQEEKEERKDQAQVQKKEGNDLYKLEEYPDAIFKYTEAIRNCPLSFKKERSIMFANRAACKIHLKQFDDGVKDCSKALDLHPFYLKVLLRRAQTYEQLEKLDEALTDYQKALELDQGCHLARAACMRLPGEIQERNEKLKTEMMGKLKDLGNMVLKPFGLSTENFKVQQDPSTGSYSMNFVQNNKTNGN